jgi:hypothetical protein
MSNWLTTTYADSGTPNLQLEHPIGLWQIQDWTESCPVAAEENCPLQTDVYAQLDIKQDQSFGYSSVTQPSKSFMEPHSFPRKDTFVEDPSEIFVFGCTAQNDYQFEPSLTSANDFLNPSSIDEHSSKRELPVDQSSTDSELLRMPPLPSADSFIQELHISQLGAPCELFSSAMSDETQFIEATKVQPTLADHIITFDLNLLSSPLKRKRSAFSLEGKKKVRSVRQNGACISCRARKVSVSII